VTDNCQKCDSKYPKCTACATAGADCQQENRLKQTLQPRGHTEQLERQLALAGALLKRFVPDFDFSHLDEICLREGIDIGAVLAALQSGENAPRLFSYPPPGMVSPAYPVALPYPPHPPGTTYPTIMPPGAYPVPVYQPHAPFALPSSAAPAPTTPRTPITPPKSAEIAGQDPQSNDMSNTEALAKNFGVNASIFKGLPLTSSGADKEDLAVGSNGLDSGRDRQLAELSIPRDKTHWVSVTIKTGNNVDSHIEPGTPPSSAATTLWLPRDRDMVNHIVEVYFTRLNPHRPVYPHADFNKSLNDLYTGQLERHDPGFLCSLYLVLALGTLSELSHRATEIDRDEATEQMLPKNLMPKDWPDHHEFFECALLVKPDLRVTISSVQALILLHWYLYTEVRVYFSPSVLFFLERSITDLAEAREDSMETCWEHSPTCGRTRVTSRSHASEKGHRFRGLPCLFARAVSTACEPLGDYYDSRPRNFHIARSSLGNSTS
jgi:hypothetical protein